MVVPFQLTIQCEKNTQIQLFKLKKILIIQTAFIGDAILATSLIESIHAAYEGECEIALVVRGGNESLFTNHPKISRVLVWNKKDKKYSNLLKLIHELRKTKFDAVYNLQRFASTGFMTWRMRSPIKVGYAENPFAWLYSRKYKHVLDGRHEISRNFDLVRADLPDTAVLLNPRLYPSELDKELVTHKINPNDRYVVLAPASVWYTKQWPKHKWVDLINSLDQNMQVYLIGSPSDQALINEIIEKSNHQHLHNLAGVFSLLQAAFLMQFAVRVFVNDSAPLHLASAVNAPVTAFFCSTVPSYGFGPLSRDSVIAQMTEQLDCRPCGLHGYKACPKGHFKCAESIGIPAL